MDQVHPLCAEEPVSSEPGLLYFPAFAPTGGNERKDNSYSLPLTIAFLLSKASPANTYFAQCWFLVPQAHNEDAVSLADAALSPWGHAVVRLVQDNSIYVLLLGQPARETILVDTAFIENTQCFKFSKQLRRN